MNAPKNWSTSTGSTFEKGSTFMCSPRPPICSSAPHVLPDVLPSQATGSVSVFPLGSTLEHIKEEKNENQKNPLKRPFYRGKKEIAADVLPVVRGGVA